MKKKLPPPSLDASTAAKVLSADLGNLLKKVQSGVPLTGRQRALIEASTNPNTKTHSPQPYAGNQVELAEVLGCNRKTIQRLLKRSDRPKTTANGKYSVIQWRAYLARHAPSALAQDDAADLPELRAEFLKEQTLKLRLKNAITRKAVMPTVLAEQIGAGVAADSRAIIESLHLCAPDLAGLTVPQIHARLKEEEEKIIRLLNGLPERIEKWKGIEDTFNAELESGTN